MAVLDGWLVDMLNTNNIEEVYLECPNYMHDYRNVDSLAPKKVNTDKNILRNYCLDIADKYNTNIDGVKLVPNLINMF